MITAKVAREMANDAGSPVYKVVQIIDKKIQEMAANGSDFYRFEPRDENDELLFFKPEYDALIKYLKSLGYGVTTLKGSFIITIYW